VTQTETTLRKQYLNGEITHREYYAMLVKKAGIEYSETHPWVQGTLKYLQHDSYDDHLIHLNWIGLKAIDMAYQVPNSVYKSVGDFYSLAGNCCIHKEAIKQAVERITGQPFPTK
jgi:hypothetical protein